MSSIAEAFSNNRSTPYGGKSVKLTVVAVKEAVSYRNKSGENRQCLHCAVSDNQEVIEAVVYDPVMFSRFRKDNTLVIHNAIKKNEDGRMVLVVTNKSKVFISTSLSIDPELVLAGHGLLNPPPAPTVSLRAALASPVKTKCSVAGKVVQEDEVRYVSVKGENVPIKTLHLSDNTASRVKVTLWRELASTGDTRPGDYIKITDLIPNVYNSEISLSATSNSTVEKTEAPLVRVSKTVVGICIQEDTAELLCEADEVLTAAAEVLQQAFPDVMDLESITKDGPKTLVFETKGSDVVSIAQTHA